MYDNFQKFFIAADHGGFELKEIIKAAYPDLKWVDFGVYNTESVDYPDMAEKVIAKMKTEKGACGVLVCGTGQGMAMTANKHPEIRAALCWSRTVTKLARAHNNANILCLGGRVIKPEMAVEMVKLFVETKFEGGRHARRVDKFSEKL